MEKNIPLHSYVYLWMIIAFLFVGYILVTGNKLYTSYNHQKNEKVTSMVLGILMTLYLMIFAFLCFFYRTPMDESHIRLEPFWSYKEAFNGTEVVRLGVARSILLNILITVPLGYLLPALYRNTKHRYAYTLLTVLALSLFTESVQFFTRTGLCETDDVINNVLGAVIGMLAYKVADMITKKERRK